MKTLGRPRREVLVAFAKEGPHPRVDVGADHGWVAQALGCIATERRAHRIARRQGTWVVSDGLDAFGPMGTAVIAGMGARTILGILETAPPVQRLVLHAQDDPPLLRRGLSSHGYRIVDEGLAPEAKRYAEVVVAVPGVESASGLTLDFGPHLLRGHHPLARAHFQQLATYYTGLANRTANVADIGRSFAETRDFLSAWLANTPSG